MVFLWFTYGFTSPRRETRRSSPGSTPTSGHSGHANPLLQPAHQAAKDTPPIGGVGGTRALAHSIIETCRRLKTSIFLRDFLKFSSFIKFSHLGATKSPFSAEFSHETQHLLSQNYSKLMFCARRPLIFMTCHKVPRLPRQYTMSALDAALPTIKHVIK